MHERGLIEGVGAGKGRAYHLNADFYRRFGQPEGYVRAHGISALRREGMVLEYVQAHGRIERKHVMELFGLSSEQAGRILSKMCEKGKLYRRGSPPRWTYYVAENS